MKLSDMIIEHWDDLSDAAQEHIRSRRAELVGEYALIEEGYEYDTIQADTIEDALAEAVARVSRESYSDARGAIWIDVRVRNTVTGDEARETVELEAEEPDCEDGELHDWQSPYCLLGGLEENPGVQGHGGGVIIREVCAHCGQYRITDSWAQDPCTGRQGLHSVEYEEADEESIRWVRRRRDDGANDDDE